MVIGNGLVASKFASYKNDDRFVVFASGVSNSKNTDQAAYQRETDLLQTTIKMHADKTLVYFSTCSINDPAEADSPYVVHKKKIEELIQEDVRSYYIFRVSNLAGKSANQNTILNFFYYHILHNINFDLWTNSARNLVDSDDMFAIADYILQKKIYSNQVINIANPISYSVKEIITALEELLGKRANYISIAKGSKFPIDISLVSPIIEELKINFDETYLSRLLKKYYSQ